MNKEIIHRPFTFRDKPGVLELMNLIYPVNGYDEAFFSWQYFENTAGKAKIFLSQSGKSIIGIYALIPNDLIAGQKKFKIWRVQDVMVHPDYRLKGIFLDLMKTAHTDNCWTHNDIFFAFPNENSYRTFEKYGYTLLSKVIYYQCREKHPYYKITSRYVIKEQENFSFMDSNKIFSDPGGRYMNISKNQEYLTWRYLHKPGAKYDIFTLEENNSIKGYMVLKKYRNNNSSSLHICELTVLNDDEAMMTQMLLFALNKKSENNAELLNAFLSSPCIEKVVKRASFECCAKERNIVFYKGLNPDESISSVLRFSLGDNDIF